MAIFKCKMCGGALEITDGMTVCECEYCGTKQTLPNLDDEKKVKLYDRANHFRRNNEYDKAMGIYESILEEDNTDAEAYWSLVLCKYGIEYVEDPTTHKRVPTVNRAQYTSVFIDEDYQAALKYADGYQRDIYEAEAKAIDEIQKGILEISNNEDPFDVFICYKETDSSGRRTEDSVYAQDIYKVLTDEGYKVFFARITLEDKLGTEYEPYIFAALNSAKVMVTVGTNSDNFNAVWVKNEWSRFMALIKAGEQKTLIPVYKNMDPYDLPDEFSYLQAQDMNKVGFMQDLVYGVKKLISQDVIDERQKKGTSSVIVDTMTKRGGEALANGDWDTAVRCYDSILDYDGNNIEALVGKLKATKHVTNLEDSTTRIDDDKNYQRIIEIADVETKEEYERINKSINDKLDAETKTLKKKKRNIITISIIFVILIAAVATVALTYQDYIAPFIAYQQASSLLEDEKYDEAREAFTALGDYKDSKNKVSECGYAKKYSEAIECMNKKDYKNASLMFDTLSSSNYSDSKEKLKECSYIYGCELFDNKDYSNALIYLKKCEGYKDANDKIRACEEKASESMYKEAKKMLDDGSYSSAIDKFETLGDYKDSKAKINEIKYLICKKEIEKNNSISAEKYAKNPPERNETIEDYIDDLNKSGFTKSSDLEAQYEKSLNRPHCILEYENTNSIHEEPYYYVYLHFYNTSKDYRVVYFLDGGWNPEPKEDWCNGEDSINSYPAGDNVDYILKYFKVYSESGELLINKTSFSEGRYYYFI